MADCNLESSIWQSSVTTENSPIVTSSLQVTLIHTKYTYLTYNADVVNINILRTKYNNNNNL